MSMVTEDCLLWSSYEYLGPGDKYHPVNVEHNGGPDDQSFIWVDDSVWSIDTPESPPSILSLLRYQSWACEPFLDLRNATVEFSLRGDDLDLKGGSCFFWILTQTPFSTRWHYMDKPLDISREKWEKPQKIILRDEPSLWHRSFHKGSGQPHGLSQTLGRCMSYGFSFTGFNEKPTGRFSLASFSLEPQLAATSSVIHQHSPDMPETY